MEPIKDLVSVIIPTYNRAGLITRSAKSVLNQTYKNLELIIVDDGSIDNTEDVVKTLDDERVIYIKQANQGACAARNNGIDHAKGEFIAFQDSDDVWHEDKLEKQIKCLKETGTDVVFCKMLRNGSSSYKISYDYAEGFLPTHRLPSGISTQTLCGKNKVFKTEKFDIQIPRLQDFELLLRVHKRYMIYCMNDELVDYFEQNDSISRKPLLFLEALKLIMNKHHEVYSASTSRTIIVYAFNCKDVQVKKELIDLAFECNSSFQTYLVYLLNLLNTWNLLKKIYHHIIVQN